MSTELLLAFIAFAFVTSVTPGPNNMMLLASGVNFGVRRSIPHMLGISLGFMVLVAAVGNDGPAAAPLFPSAYPQVIGGGTGHMEAVQVTYDPQRVTYEDLLNAYWHSIDPTDPNGQFCDQGPSYRSAVFATAAQRADAVASRDAAMRVLRKSFTTPVVGAQRFWPAGEEHQNYAKRHAASYQAYRIGCRRPERLRAIWGDAAVS